MISRDASVKQLMTGVVTPYIDDPAVTEICVNRPGEVWTYKADQWHRHKTDATIQQLESLAVAIARYYDSDISETVPMLSAIMPNGDRIQIIRSPACEHGTLSLTIRKPSITLLSLDDYEPSFFDQREQSNTDDLVELFESCSTHDFLLRSVERGRNIVIAGETNSGKTTLMKALMLAVPAHERIITIEDVPELLLPNHDNRVHLFYQHTDSEKHVTASDCLRAALRMNPDRIMPAELRGAETFNYLNVVASGHDGSITSVHAGSCDQAIERMALMCLQAKVSLTYEVIKRMLVDVIDIVVHLAYEPDRGRYITEIKLP